MAISRQETVQVEIVDVLYHTSGSFGIVLLQEVGGVRVLPLHYHGSEVFDLIELACQLREVRFPLPASRTLMFGLLAEYEAAFEGVVIHGIHVFTQTGQMALLARALFRRDTLVTEVEVRLNQLIPVLVALKRPLWIAEQVLNELGVVFPSELQSQVGVGTDRLLQCAPAFLEIPWPEDDPFDTELSHTRFQQDIAVRDLIHYSRYRTTKPPDPQPSGLQKWWSSLRRSAPGRTDASQLPIPHMGTEPDPSTRPRISAEGRDSTDVVEP